MQKARKLANKRASQFRRERGAHRLWHPQWRRKRKGEKGDEYGYVEAARGYDDIRKVADDKDELTATAGDGLWRVASVTSPRRLWFPADDDAGRVEVGREAREGDQRAPAGASRFW